MSNILGSIKYDGWHIYTNTGRLHRRWEFTEDVPDLDAVAGDTLEDRGPGGDPRFRITGDDGSRCPDADDVEAAFSSALPAWDPPNEEEIRIRRHLDAGRGPAELSHLLQRLAGAIRDGAAPSGGSPGTDHEGLQFGCLVVEREGRYGNTGGRFRIWRFLEDRPEIPATDLDRHGDVGGALHAMKGDQLWQEPDRLSPFKIKRDEREIGTPENWQLRGAFGGKIPGWPLKPEQAGDEDAGSHEDTGPAPGLYGYVSEETVGGQSVETGAGPYKRRGVYRLTRDLPAVEMEAGDVLVYAYDREDRPEHIKGKVRGLDPDDIEDLRDALEGVWLEHDANRPREMPPLAFAIRECFECLSGPTSAMVGETRENGYGSGGRWCGSGLYHFLDNANRWGRRLTDFYARLLLLRPVFRGPEVVSRPVRAASPASAAFELLAQVTEDE